MLEKHVPSSASRPRKPAKPKDPPAGKQFRGPYASAGPYERDDRQVEVRLEKVPGGIRLASWAAGALQREAPVLPASDLRGLIAQARERSLLPERDIQKLEAAAGEQPAGDRHVWGASSGRAGDLKEELRVEDLGDGNVRVARWILRPGAEWELQEAPPMLPAARFAEALAAAARAGAA